MVRIILLFSASTTAGAASVRPASALPKKYFRGGLLLPAEPARFPVRRATDTPAPAGTPSAVGPADEAAFRHSYLRPSRQIRTRRECADSTKNIECLFPAPAGRTGRDGTAHGPSKTASRGGEGRPGELRAARSSALSRPPDKRFGRRAVPPPREARTGRAARVHRKRSSKLTRTIFSVARVRAV